MFVIFHFEVSHRDRSREEMQRHDAQVLAMLVNFQLDVFHPSIPLNDSIPIQLLQAAAIVVNAHLDVSHLLKSNSLRDQHDDQTFSSLVIGQLETSQFDMSNSSNELHPCHVWYIVVTFHFEVSQFDTSNVLSEKQLYHAAPSVVTAQFDTSHPVRSSSFMQ